MKYPEGLSLGELIQYYVNYRSEEILNELARRDKLNQVSSDERMEQRFEEPDNQTVFDFHKKVASAKKVANNRSVKTVFKQRTDEAKRMSGAWEEAYETGRRVGFKQGLKDAQPSLIPSQGYECNCGDLDVSFSGV